MTVNIVDVCSRITEDGRPLGHEDKAIRQAINLIDCECEVTVGKEYLKNEYPCKTNGYLKCRNEQDNRIKKYLTILQNTIISSLKNNCDVMWFIYVEELVLILLAVIPYKSKIIVTTYRDWEEKLNACKLFKGIRFYLYRKAIKKINLLILTDSNCKVRANSISFPDFYLEVKYKKYISGKKEGVVCVGLMSPSKGVLEVARAFNKSDMSIRIEGYFEDTDYYEKVLAYSNNRVIVKNTLLNYDEYMKIIGTAKYVVIPYNAKKYCNSSSGVLQETIAMNSIPIGSKSFIEYNHVSGITYENIDEIPQRILDFEKEDKLISNNYEHYDYSQCKKRLKVKFAELNK